MKEEIRQILDQHFSHDTENDKISQDILDLFISNLSKLEDQSAKEAEERYSHVRNSCDYRKGLEDGFESGVEWVSEKISDE